MRPNGFHDRRNLGFRKAELPQYLRRLAAGISHVVPSRQRGRVLGTMAGENPEVMQPRRSEKHVIIAGLTLGKPFRELIKPGLMTEFVQRLGLGADVFNNALSVSGLTHGLRPMAASMART